MSNSWQNTKTDTEAQQHAFDFWSRHSEDLKSGEFWADKIKKLRGEPVKRLALALQNLPLPASFREASIATRTLIREKRKINSNYEDELGLLYWLAAIESFSIPYSEILQEPGFNVMESIPGDKLKTLPFTYNELGYQELNLLNKTDVKWLIETWGEPNTHTTLHDMHIDVWQEYETKLKENREKRMSELFQTPNDSVEVNNDNLTHLPSSKKSIGTKLFIAAIIMTIVIIFIL